MTSSKPRELFIYLQLPHSMEVVTAAKLTWREVPDNRAIGEVVYGKRFLDRARSQGFPALDPISLPVCTHIRVAIAADASLATTTTQLELAGW